jgi:chromosome partitioning protein
MGAEPSALHPRSSSPSLTPFRCDSEDPPTTDTLCTSPATSCGQIVKGAGQAVLGSRSVGQFGCTVTQVIVVTAALKGGVGKTTTSVYLAALAAASNRRTATLIDADPQASAAEWIENSGDERFERVTVVEAPTDRLLTRALNKSESNGVVIVDTPPAHERLTAKAVSHADVVVVPTRVGGIEVPRVDALFEIVPDSTPAGLVICSARTFTRSYHEAVDQWSKAGYSVWGTAPERVAITAGPAGPLSYDGLDAYRRVWRRAQSAARNSG